MVVEVLVPSDGICSSRPARELKRVFQKVRMQECQRQRQRKSETERVTDLEAETESNE